MEKIINVLFIGNIILYIFIFLEYLIYLKKDKNESILEDRNFAMLVSGMSFLLTMSLALKWR
ncbi:MAG: hypothetical protein KHZ94_07360 [Anaerostipes sp.]|uniref:hypothetical protein n=1 Tax=Anaerostipes sp. TaxID=1872530 RepID=UPI00257D31B8|nr:hypothetical protein [Anaerostipes sp.]MBS4928204.1 hypothetical protein [Anaerostipes sp.]